MTYGRFLTGHSKRIGKKTAKQSVRVRPDMLERIYRGYRGGKD